MRVDDRTGIRQKALEALQQSTKTLEIAEQLIKVGNLREAERLRDEARRQRNLSVSLMASGQYVDSDHDSHSSKAEGRGPSRFDGH